MLNKRGQGSWYLQWLIRMLFSIFVLISIAVLADKLVVKNVSVADVEGIVIAERFVWARSGILEQNTLYHRTVDLDRFQTDIIEDSINISGNHLAARLEIAGQSAHLNERNYIFFEPLIGRGGLGGVHKWFWDPLVRDEDETRRLSILVVTPNE